MMNLMNVILMAPPAAGSNPNPVMQFLPLILIGIVFYFFMIRPQTKKMKDQKNFIEAIKKGDKVVTIGGIHGKIADINEDTYLLEIENGVKMKIDKVSVSLEASKKINS
jgi:preprotein translocase subunit YajC